MTLPIFLDTNILHYVRENRIWDSIATQFQPFLMVPVPAISIVSVAELRSLQIRHSWEIENATD